MQRRNGVLRAGEMPGDATSTTTPPITATHQCGLKADIPALGSGPRHRRMNAGCQMSSPPRGCPPERQRPCDGRRSRPRATRSLGGCTRAALDTPGQGRGLGAPVEIPSPSDHEGPLQRRGGECSSPARPAGDRRALERPPTAAAPPRIRGKGSSEGRRGVATRIDLKPSPPGRLCLGILWIAPH
jgi:hypothetical protein